MTAIRRVRAFPFDRITILCDVRNPLTGPHGAASVFGPQKGASPRDVRLLEAGLRHYARRLRVATGRDVSRRPGAGAAGGLAAGFAAFGARLVEGGPHILRILRLEHRIRSASLVITGEGRVDRTTRQGKAVGAVCAMARRHRVPVAVLCGSTSLSAKSVGADALASLLDHAPGKAESIRHVRAYLPAAVDALLHRLKLLPQTGR
jgi:glycerate kinase